MWLFGRQYSNFLRFYSNLLAVVFLLYDLTYLLQWQVMQYLIDFYHPHHVSIRAAVPKSFLTTEQSTITIFVSCFHPVVQMCPFLTAAQSLPCTQFCSQSPAPAASASHQALSSPNPAHLPCHQAGDTSAEVEMLWSHSSSVHFLVTAFSQAHTQTLGRGTAMP